MEKIKRRSAEPSAFKSGRGEKCVKTTNNRSSNSRGLGRTMQGAEKKIANISEGVRKKKKTRKKGSLQHPQKEISQGVWTTKHQKGRGGQ